MTTRIQFTTEQENFLQAATDGYGNLALQSLAGTGKTTVALELARRMRNRRILYTTFNREPINSAKKKAIGIPNLDVFGLHQLGNKALGMGLTNASVNLDRWGDGHNKVIKEWLRDNRGYVEWEDMKDIQKFLKETLSYAMSQLANMSKPDVLMDIVHTYRLDSLLPDGFEPEQLIGAIPPILAGAIADAERGSVTYDGMIYFPVLFEYAFPTYDLVIIDEAQDLSPLMKKIVQRCMGAGRVIAVGDPHQSIYHFTGADSESFASLVDKFNMDVYPMTLTFRCGQEVTRHAREVVETFHCPPEAQKGAILYEDEGRLGQLAQDGDLVLCRINAPLVEEVLKMVAQGRSVEILGRDLSTNIVALVTRAEKVRGFTFDNLLSIIDDYVMKRSEKLRERSDHSGAIQLKDRFDVLQLLFSTYMDKTESAQEFRSVGMLVEFIKTFFKPSGKNPVRFSTVHRAKGTEADQVFMLNPELLYFDHPDATPDMKAQEAHVDYVSRSRARTNYIYLTNAEFDAQDRKVGAQPTTKEMFSDQLLVNRVRSEDIINPN